MSRGGGGGGNWEGVLGGRGASSEGESNLTAPVQAKDDLGSALGKKGLGCQVGQWWIFFPSPNKRPFTCSSMATRFPCQVLIACTGGEV